MEDIIRITNLDKRFGSVHAVNDLSFKVKKGELFAFLGVNGAGKSTTISIMCGLLKKDGGSAEVCGKTLKRIWRKSRRKSAWFFRIPLSTCICPLKTIFYPARGFTEFSAKKPKSA